MNYFSLFQELSSFVRAVTSFHSKELSIVFCSLLHLHTCSLYFAWTVIIFPLNCFLLNLLMYLVRNAIIFCSNCYFILFELSIYSFQLSFNFIKQSFNFYFTRYTFLNCHILFKMSFHACTRLWWKCYLF